jgi:hypothetical protein
MNPVSGFLDCFHDCAARGFAPLVKATPRAKAVYESLRGVVAFNLPTDARKVGANQYGTRYVFPDGSYLRVDCAGNQIEWRERYPREGSPGAVRFLFERGR